MMENINEIKSDQKKLFDLLEEQKEIKEIITKIIDTIVLQKKIVKFKSKKCLRESYIESQKFKIENFKRVLLLLEECDKSNLDLRTMALQVIKHDYQVNDANFNKKVQSIFNAESDKVYSRLKSYNDVFFYKMDKDSNKLIQELRKFVIHDKNEDELSVQIEKLELQKKIFYSMLEKLTNVNI